MKKHFTLAFFLLSLIPLSAQNLTGIDKWILKFPAGKADFAGFPITKSAVEANGAFIVFDRSGTVVRLNLIKPVELAALTDKYRQAEKALLSGLTGDAWSVAINSCEIDLGLKDELTVTLALGSFRFRLDPETMLELAGRLEGDPVFYSQTRGGFIYSLRFKGVASGTGVRDAFPGWGECVNRTLRWFEKGVKDKNRETIALILDAKIMSQAEKQNQTRIILSKDTRSNLWLGLNVGYLMPGLVSGERMAIVANPFTYDLLLPMFYLSWRNLGDSAWLAKPFRFTIYFGGFFEFNAGYFAMRDAGYLLWTTSPISGLFAFGPAAGFEFSAMIPKIANNNYTGDLFGIGIQLLTVFNAPNFFPEYEYGYFLSQFVNIVFHLLPEDGLGVDAILGFNFMLGTENYADGGAITLDRFGITVGARLRFDFQNFYLTDKMFE